MRAGLDRNRARGPRTWRGSRAAGAGGEITWGIVRDLVSLMTGTDPARIGVRVIR
jgi:hypothetical protein